MNNRFVITKIGLLNFWLYDEEEYDFYGGNLILRGTNGSGKSVTMQSFIPLILDGNKNPERLDPFGSKERKIEDYIIGDSESIQKEEATSYLYMETYNDFEKKYITIGLGFRGRKGRGVESWGFSLKDGKRINKDFYLYKDPVNKIPLSKNELKSRLGDINEFTDTMRDYKVMVNRLLFGFPNLDTYDEFIKLLLQLRSNKLSKDYKPTNLINVLNTVLQPLSEEDLRPLSEAIEQMNKTKEYVENLEKNSKSLKDFLKVYKNYNEIILLTKARNYQKVYDNFQELKEKIDAFTKDILTLKETLNHKNNQYTKVCEDIRINNELKRQLDSQDLKQKIENLVKIQEEIANLEQQIKDLDLNLSKSEENKLVINKKILQNEDEIYKLKKEINETLNDLGDFVEESYFDELNFFKEELESTLDQPFSFETIMMAIKDYQGKVNQIKTLLEEENQINLASQNKRVELEKLIKNYQTLERDIDNNERNLKESIMAWEEDFINKLNHNLYLKLEDGIKKQIFDLMNDYSNENYNLVKSLYEKTARDLINEVISVNLNLEIKRNSLKKDLKDREDAYQKIEMEEDVEIPSLNEETDKILKENNIRTIPLYKCIEFKDGISEEIKNNIESSLLDLNILNAKIIKESDLEKVSKLKIQLLYLTRTTKKEQNLLKYFNVKLENQDFSQEYIDEILASISISLDDALCILEDGHAKIDVLNSKADVNYKQTFIGYLKRRELKEKKLKALREEIEVLTKEIVNINNLISHNNEKINFLEQESSNLPSNMFINEIVNKLNELTMSLDWNNQKQKELEEELIVVDEKLKEIKNRIVNYKQGLNIPLNLNAYKEVSLLIPNILEMIHELKTIHSNYLSKLDISHLNQEHYNSIMNNINYLNDDKTEKETLLKINIQNVNNINELLETKEYKEQKDKLLKAEADLSRLNKEKEILIEEIATCKSNLSHQERDLEELSVKFKNLENELNIYQEIFLREYKLKYVYQDEIVDINKTVKNIIKEGRERKEVSLNDALNNFYSSYNHYSLELNDYSLRSQTLFNDYDLDNLDEFTKKIYLNNTRVDVLAMYQGIKLNIIKLAEKINDEIVENKDLISKQDRYLFEDILLNTVGEKIREKINSSNEWVKKINNIMAKMQENSALGFKLVWKSIEATSDDEIDTKELVRILKMDPKMLKDADTQKVTNHFRSKIKKAEDLYQDSFISFYKIIEEVLDYRSWFTFKLLYERKGMSEKELTDKTFAKFSGGERAKSMYIPLFASVYAKLNLAKENSLRVIALDEAFAGVDEDNIREMFGILKYLNLNFIINSQVLWGDYDTVSKLSICELIRPQNSQVVTVERYRWNGKYKEIINDRTQFSGEENA